MCARADQYRTITSVLSRYVRRCVKTSCGLLVMLCSHGAAIMGDALEPDDYAHWKAVVRHDRNAVCVGFAADALTRLVNLQPDDEPMPPPIQDLRANLMAILKASPVHSLDALSRAGLGSAALSEFIPAD